MRRQYGSAVKISRQKTSRLTDDDGGFAMEQHDPSGFQVHTDCPATGAVK